MRAPCTDVNGKAEGRVSKCCVKGRTVSDLEEGGGMSRWGDPGILLGGGGW